MDIQTESLARRARHFAFNWGVAQWATLVSTVISILALATSIHTCKGSGESNRIARQALTASQDAFVAQSRPYLVVQPRKHPDNTNEYVHVTSSSTSTTVEIWYEVKNVGVTPAQSVRILPDSTLHMKGRDTVAGNAIFSFGGLPVVSLGPGEKWGLVHRQDLLKVGGGMSMEHMAAFLTNETITIETDVGLSYASRSAPNREFITRARHAFHGNFPSVLDSRYEERPSSPGQQLAK